MNAKQHIAANTRYAFACIALMLLAFLLFAAVMITPLGLLPNQQLIAMRIALYGVLLFAVLGGAFSVRVAFLRKKYGK